MSKIRGANCAQELCRGILQNNPCRKFAGRIMRKHYFGESLFVRFVGYRNSAGDSLRESPPNLGHPAFSWEVRPSGRGCERNIKSHNWVSHFAAPPIAREPFLSLPSSSPSLALGLRTLYRDLSLASAVQLTGGCSAGGPPRYVAIRDRFAVKHLQWRVLATSLG